jgi:hypothetical protein
LDFWKIPAHADFIDMQRRPNFIQMLVDFASINHHARTAVTSSAEPVLMIPEIAFLDGSCRSEVSIDEFFIKKQKNRHSEIFRDAGLQTIHAIL